VVASLKDVAARAGVSVKTVSNVVNDYAHVTEATRARVRQAIEELNYHPNVSARSLRRGRSGIIALAVPELDLPYFSELARFIIHAAEERHLTVLIDQTDGVPEREQLVLDGIRGGLIDGLIFSPLAADRCDLEQRRDRTPMVLLGERVYDAPADHVMVDNVEGARLATQHLLSLGRRRVAAIGRQHRASSGTAQLRLLGYQLALQQAGRPLDDDLVVVSDSYHRADGRAAMERLLDGRELPDAVFCFNDLLALGAMRALSERGLHVPDDVAVVGFDDIEDGRYAVPSLSTVSPNKEQIARYAVDLLVVRLSSASDSPPRARSADLTLIPRESTVGARVPASWRATR